MGAGRIFTETYEVWILKQRQAKEERTHHIDSINGHPPHPVKKKVKCGGDILSESVWLYSRHKTVTGFTVGFKKWCNCENPVSTTLYNPKVASWSCFRSRFP